MSIRPARRPLRGQASSRCLGARYTIAAMLCRSLTTPHRVGSNLWNVKVAFLPDCHLDHGKHGRWADIAWKRACTEIAEGGYTAAIGGGDLFQTGRPSMEALVRCLQGIEQLVEAGVEVILIAGNHEWQGVKAAQHHHSPVSVLDKMPDITAVTHPQGLYVGDDLWVAALPWPAPGMAGSQPEHALRLAEEATNVDAARLAVSHASVAEAILWPGSEVELTTAPPAATARLADLDHPDAFERTLMGHFHTPRRLSPTCSYTGSLECFTFADEGRVGGWTSLERIDNRWVETFVEAGQSRFETINMDRDLSDVPAGTFVRVRVQAGESRLDYDSAAVEAAGLSFVGFYDEAATDVAVEQAITVAFEPAKRSPSDIAALLDRWALQRGLTERHQQLLRDAASDLLGWAPPIGGEAAA